MPAHEYPRPQLVRRSWESLNGTWDFAIDAAAEWTDFKTIEWSASIKVPFSPETPASGVQNTSFYRAVWYRRTFQLPKFQTGERVFLHFGAVDHVATVWVNGAEVICHQGGYTPFRSDITDALTDSGPQELIVRAEDDPLDLAKPRGKQDWKLEPHLIWYPRTTGIWQTVWLETVPASYIEVLRWSSNFKRWEIALEAHIAGVREAGLELRVKMHNGDHVLSDDAYSVVAGEVHRRIALSDPGVDDYRNELLWSPTSPTIIDVELELRKQDGTVFDYVSSYTALRGITTQGDRFILNGRPMALRMVLDQGYWPESGLTAPDDNALRQDVLLAKQLGFNGVRKHQKIEDPRYLYWADHLGLLVWEEMPSAYRFTRKSIDRLTREWIEVLERDSSHPCIITWVPFNESWGVPDLPESMVQRNYVRALYYLTKTLDPTRPVIGNDGWESVATDIIGIHDYDEQPARMRQRYGGTDMQARLFKRERPGGRMLLVDPEVQPDQPIMITEFGGIALSGNRDRTWGYSRSDSPRQLLERYRALIEVVSSLRSVAGFCYTQFADTYQEANGLLFADRKPKAPIEELAKATNGQVSEDDPQQEADWRDRIMERQR